MEWILAAKAFVATYRTWFVIAAVLAVVGFIFYLGGVGPRAERDELIAKYEAAGDEFELIQDIHQEESNDQKERLDRERENALVINDSTWGSQVADLERLAADADRARAAAERRLLDSRRRDGAQPVREPTGCPPKAAGDDGLPDAVEVYIAAERSREERERAATARLLQTCGKQAIDLKGAFDYVEGETRINKPVEQPLVRP